ncbi:MAG TPA: GTPase ObgE [Atribacter sp.]|uniref:GTPase Obg n=1 Tax=Candidatus Atribacter allofermentans TaxID=1852833 RepID=A0A1V5STY8_9BACT|nr:GTPase ObgE [Atribacter sp.]MDD3713727.1 GTPase ObgE [Atribacterota bacterium]OQA58000.1 MAG: GTPase ObgE [Candidatus Atribacteria bacterium ADurb.Bin276]MDI9595589.1 GTPase ObgE [Atribacterota bacterium]HOT04677.1 GTPase ObgE [Atribacter sp.]HQK82366.1 GTPase ObgE [Atribacter sp.]
MFVDQVILKVRAGRGGDGAISFLREKYVPRGGPAGGNGGKGGNVIAIALSQKKTLYDVAIQKVYEASNGEPGKGKNQFGKDGADVVLVVPVGTQIIDQKDNQIIADLTEDKQEVIIARGGRGGRGNSSFATSTNQAPRIAEKGELGEAREIRLELKLIADVGISGFPNAGKSTLLSVVSAAKPRIADYPFTTLHPNLGVVNHHDQQFIMVDVPGIIEGASRGAGLGLEFLRHIERTRLILHCVDLSQFYSENNPYDDFLTLRREFEAYSSSLAAKPFFVVATKLDLIKAAQNFNEFKSTLEQQGIPVFGVSSLTKEGMNQLLDAIIEFLKNAPEIFTKEILSQSKNTPLSPIRSRHYRFSTPFLDRLIAEIDWNSDNALSIFNQKLVHFDFLKYFSAIQPGSIVEIENLNFIWTGKRLEAHKTTSK